MMRTRWISTLLIAAGTLAPSAALAQNRVDQQMFLDLRVIQEQQQDLRRLVNTLIEQIQTVNTRLDAEASARNKGFADAQTLIAAVNDNVSKLTENVRDGKVKVADIGQEVEALKKGLDILTQFVTQALAQMPAAGTPAGANADASTPPGSAPPPGNLPPTGVPASATEYYQSAQADYAAGHFDMAISGYQEFIKRFSNAPQAPKAQFFVGESYASLGKWKDAADAYDLVIKNYGNTPTSKSPDPDTVADAYLGQGVAYERLGQKDQAIANYKLIQKDYPGTTAEFQATKYLKRLGVIK